MKKTKTQLKKEFYKKTDIYFELAYWLFTHKSQIKNIECFDYPDYSGLPKNISSKLSSQTVDIIQDNWEEIQKSRSLQYLLGLFLI